MFRIFSLFAWWISIALGGLLSLSFMGRGIWLFIPHIFLSFVFGAIIRNIFFSDATIRRYLRDEEYIYTHSDRPHQKDISVGVPSDLAQQSARAPYFQQVVENQGTPQEASLQTDPIIPVSSSSKTSEVPSQIQVLMGWVVSYFSDRPLAKIGGLLIFISGLFFLSYLFIWVGALGRLLIGEIAALTVIIVGSRISRSEGPRTEGMIVEWVGIAIWFLSLFLGFTYAPELFPKFVWLLLILGTTIATILLADRHRSVDLLAYAFFWSYISPLFVSGDSLWSFFLGGYLACLTIAYVIIISRYDLETSQKVRYELFGSIAMLSTFGISLLSSSDIGQYGIHVWFLVSIAAHMYYAWRERLSLTPLFIGAYVVVFLWLFRLDSISAYLLGTLGVLLASFFALVWGVLAVFLFPALLILAFSFGLTALFLGGLGFEFFVFYSLVVSILWLTGIYKIVWLSRGAIQGIMWAIALFFLIPILSLWFLGGDFTLTCPQTVLIDVILISFLFVGAFLAYQRQDIQIYNVSLFGSGVLMFFTSDALYFWLPGVTLGIYLALSLVLPLMILSRSTSEYDIGLLGLSYPISAIALITSLLLLPDAHPYHAMLPVAFLLLSGIYATYGSYLLSQVETFFVAHQWRESDSAKRFILAFLIVPITVLAIAFSQFFSSYHTILSLTWFIEAMAVLALAELIGQRKLRYVAEILILGSIWKLIISYFGPSLSPGVGILTTIFYFLLLIGSLWLMRKVDQKERIFFDILHFIQMGLVLGWALEFIRSTGSGVSLLLVAVLLSILSVVYRYIAAHYLSIILLFYVFFWSYFFTKFWYLRTGLLPSIYQGMALFLPLLHSVFLLRAQLKIRWLFFFVNWIGFLILSSCYVWQIFGRWETWLIFITLYLALIAMILLIIGIQSGDRVYRFLGLQIGVFVLAKILLSDLWISDYGIESRIFMLMIIGAMMMYLSQAYAKKVNQTWKEEFSFPTFFSPVAPQPSSPESSSDIHDSMKTTPDDLQAEPTPFAAELAKELDTVDIAGVTAIRFSLASGESFLLRRKWVIQLACSIEAKLHKTTFGPGELSFVRDHVMTRLMSHLPPAELQTLLDRLDTWVRVGGSFEIIRKS